MALAARREAERIHLKRKFDNSQGEFVSMAAKFMPRQTSHEINNNLNGERTAGGALYDCSRDSMRAVAISCSNGVDSQRHQMVIIDKSVILSIN